MVFFRDARFAHAIRRLIDGTTIRIHYGAPHMIVVDQIDAAIIEQALHYIERQGELLACTIRIEKPDETDLEKLLSLC